MNSFLETTNLVLGLRSAPENLTFPQIALRGVIVFFAALLMVRLGDKRFLSNKTAFDAILGFILASMLARAVNGSVAFFPTLGAGFVLIALHHFLAFCARRSHWLGNVVKGRCDLVIKEGVVVEAALRKNNLSRHDLCEDLRLNGNVQNPQQVQAAFVERNGQVSVVK